MGRRFAQIFVTSFFFTQTFFDDWVGVHAKTKLTLDSRSQGKIMT